MHIAEDALAWSVTTAGQQWDIAWYPLPEPPGGISHGSAAVCITADHAVLISSDCRRRGLPGGRPEVGEDWLDVLIREVHEEASVTVTEHRLLGFSRSNRTVGHHAGLVLVRAWWAASVELPPWQPLHEITHRELVRPELVRRSIWMEDGYEPLYLRIVRESGLSISEERPCGCSTHPT